MLRWHQHLHTGAGVTARLLCGLLRAADSLIPSRGLPDTLSVPGVLRRRQHPVLLAGVDWFVAAGLLLGHQHLQQRMDRHCHVGGLLQAMRRAGGAVPADRPDGGRLGQAVLRRRPDMHGGGGVWGGACAAEGGECKYQGINSSGDAVFRSAPCCDDRATCSWERIGTATWQGLCYGCAQTGQQCRKATPFGGYLRECCNAGNVCTTVDEGADNFIGFCEVTPLPTGPSPDVASPAPCTPPLPPAPPVPPPRPEDDLAKAECILFHSDGSIIDGPVTKTCGQCQWQCLTSLTCAGISLYDSSNYISQSNLYGYNCGDGSWDGGLGLCVLLAADGTLLETQHQGCEECSWQCENWEQCAGVWYAYNFYAKGDLQCCT